MPTSPRRRHPANRGGTHGSRPTGDDGEPPVGDGVPDVPFCAAHVPHCRGGRRCPPMAAPPTGSRLSKNLLGYKYRREGYHRLARANTPDSVSFRRFLPFSPWRASASLQRNVARQHRREYADSARLRLKNQKSLENPSLSGAGSFAGAEMRPDKERPAENTIVLSRDLTLYGPISARQNRVCPCQAMVR